ncbi:MAG: DNA primase [Anaerolineaceae bacterium]|nr:DNA primase [Anaerolineaceae bacterium]
MSVTDEIKARIDIVAYVQQYVPIKKAGNTWKACCPFHAERTPSFVVNPDRQTWRCFGACAEGGDLFTFAQKYHGWSFNEALEELGKQAGVEVRQQTPEQRAQYEHLDVLRGLLQAAADGYHHALTHAGDEGAIATLRYVHEKRGLNDATIQQFGIGYAHPGWQNMLEHLQTLGYTPDQIIEVGLAIKNDQGRVYDRFRNRLMIPIRDERGRVMGFGARALDPDDNPKYLNSPQTSLFDKSKTLFGLDMAKKAIRDTETVVMVEGYMDAIQAYQAGFQNVVAQMGTAMTEPQVRTLAKTAKKLILALDSDAAGQSATRRSLEVARQTLQADYGGKLALDIRILSIPGAKDPDDLIRESPERWSALVAEALPVAEYVIQQETAALPESATIQERQAAARRVLPLLLASESNLYRQDNLQKLALKLRIGESDLLAWAEEQRRIDEARPPQPAPASAEMPPDLPPPPEFDGYLPPLDYDGFPSAEGNESPYAGLEFAPAAPAPAPRPRSAPSQDAVLEGYCLRLLLRDPRQFYVVNRKFRELAGGDTALLAGPLGEWGARDFIHTTYHALMVAFEEALAQDDQEPLDFLRTTLNPVLRAEIEAIMVDDLDILHEQVRHRFAPELQAAWNQTRRFTTAFNLGTELVEQALRLRAQRLGREREELRFLQMDDENDVDTIQRIVLSKQAKHLIDAELQRQISPLHE